MIENRNESSPRWGSAMKMVVALTIIAILAAILIRFRTIIGPLLLSLMLSYLLHPAAAGLVRRLKIKWSLAVSLLFVLIILVLSGLLTWGGFALVTQLTTFIEFLQRTVTTLPETITTLSQQTITLGTYSFNLAQYDLNQLIDPILGGVQPILSSMGVLVAKFAGGAAEVIGWIAFILLVAYFILFESKGISGQIISVELPGYALDIRRMGTELGKIWNAFLRGQLLIIAITIVIYTVLLSILGLRFALGLALLAGLARFVPYVGPAVAWTTLGLVAFFQPENYFRFTPLVYALVCVGLAWIMDVALDNLVATRILAKALKVHPAAVLVMALVGANLIGLIGVVLASPVTASIKLFGRYIIRKLFDLDPWDGLERMESAASDPRWVKALRRLWKRIVITITKGSPQTK